MPRTKIALSITELLAELNRRQKKLPKLRKLAARLEKKLAAVVSEIESLGGALPAKTVRKSAGKPAAAKKASKAPRKRPRNKSSLGEAVVSVLSKDEPKSVSAIIAAVKKAGYKTTSKNFATIVYQTLARDKKRVGKAGRGLYVLKG